MSHLINDCRSNLWCIFLLFFFLSVSSRCCHSALLMSYLPAIHQSNKFIQLVGPFRDCQWRITSLMAAKWWRKCLEQYVLQKPSCMRLTTSFAITFFSSIYYSYNFRCVPAFGALICIIMMLRLPRKAVLPKCRLVLLYIFCTPLPVKCVARVLTVSPLAVLS